MKIFKVILSNMSDDDTQHNFESYFVHWPLKSDVLREMETTHKPDTKVFYDYRYDKTMKALGDFEWPKVNDNNFIDQRINNSDAWLVIYEVNVVENSHY